MNRILDLKKLILYSFVAFVSCKTPCDQVEKQKETKISGVVKERYIREWGKNSRILDLHEDNIFLHKRIYLRHETSGFWDFIQVGDSVYKEANTMHISVFRGDEKVEFELTFPYCREVSP